MKRSKLFLGAALSLVLTAFTVVPQGKVWLGIGAVAAANGASWRANTLLGVLGVSDGVLYSIALDGVVAGPAGIAVGAAVGL
jgi:hypothetical protein